MYKAELYHLKKITKPNYEQFYTDSILEQYGHSVSNYPLINWNTIP